MIKVLSVTALTLVIQGCSLFQPKVVACNTQIKYSGYSVEVSGLELPVGAQKTFRIGRLETKPEKVQEARDVTQALDLLQFSDCQFALLVPKEQVLEVRKHRDATLLALTELLTSVNAAATEAEHDSAVENGKKRLADLQSDAHSKANPTKP